MSIAICRPPLKNEHDFERLCLLLLKRHWSSPSLQLYGRRGQAQQGIDIVDIADPSGRPRAAQCKAYNPTRVFTAKDINAAVELALAFEPKLSEFHILTTAKNSTEAQQAVIQINKNHGALGKFPVFFHSWQDIEVLLEQYQDVADAIYPPSNSAINDVSKDVSALNAKLDVALADRGETTHDRDLDRIKALVDKRDVAPAKYELERMRADHWHTLNNHQRFRLLSNLGAVYFIRGVHDKAGRLFLEAKFYEATEEKALLNEVLGYYLLQESKKAFALASELRHSYPHSTQLAALWVNSAPADMLPVELESYIPEHLRDDAEVAAAFSCRALLAQQFDFAVRYGQIAAAKDHRIEVQLVYAQAIIRQVVGDAIGQPSLMEDAKRKALQQAETILGNVIRLAADQNNPAVRARALIERSFLLQLSKKNDDAASDLDEAFAENPSDAVVRREYAKALLERGEENRAIDMLRKLLDGQFHEAAAYMLAIALQKRALSGDLEEALSLLTKLTTSGPEISPTLTASIVSTALSCYAAQSKFAEARNFLAGVSQGGLSAILRVGLEARLYLAESRHAEATAAALQAATMVHVSTSSYDLDYIASLLTDVGQYKEALPLWQRVAGHTRNEQAYRKLVECAARLRRHDIILEVCQKLRSAGVTDSNLLQLEIDLLEAYELPKAITVLQEWVAQHPDDKEARLRLSHIGIVHDRPELVSATVADMPSPQSSRPLTGRVAVIVLKMAGKPLEALRYAYQLLRSHFDSPEAHRAYLFSLHPFSSTLDIPIPETVDSGCAVAVREEGVTEPKWFVIEDEGKPDSKLDEIGTDHPIANRLLGKRIGDKADLSDNSISARPAEIVQILSKYVYRYRKCGDEWQLRFPMLPDMQVLRIKQTEAGEPDLSEIKALLDKRQQNVERLLEGYRTLLIPIHCLSELLGKTELETIPHLVQQNEPLIRCCIGTFQERQESLASLAAANRVVIDITAIVTLSLLGCLDVLKSFGIPLVVSQATAEVIKGVLLDSRSEESAKGGHLFKVGSGIGVVKTTPEQSALRQEKLRSIVEVVERCTKITSTPELALLPPERRETLMSVFGTHGSESLMLASQPGSVLWTDDFVMGGLLANEFGGKRTWTQVTLEGLVSTGRLSPETFVEASTRLLECGYSFTSASRESFLNAARRANWDPNVPAFREAIRYLGIGTIDLTPVLQLAASLVKELFTETQLPERRELVMLSVLSSLGKRKDGRAGVKALQQALNVAGQSEAADIITRWLAISRNELQI